MRIRNTGCSAVIDIIAFLIVQALSQKDTTWTKLFVGGLPYHTTDKTLRKADNAKFCSLFFIAVFTMQYFPFQTEV
jgi:hypothetical protein